MVIRDVWASRETDTNFKKALDAGSVEIHTQGLDVGVGLEGCAGRLDGADYACYSANCTGDNLSVGILLTFDSQILVKNSRAEPVVGIVFWRR